METQSERKDARLANRLTDQDRRRIGDAVDDHLRLLKACSIEKADANRELIRRAAFHSIGCAEYDLRDSEIAEIDQMIERTLTS
jgi:hypothetical protein